VSEAATIEDPLAYRRALGHYPTGVVVVTADAGDEVAAITVNSFLSVSLEPRLVLWSLANSSSRYARFATQERWGLSVLGAEQRELAAVFATRGARLALPLEIQRLGGVPVVKGALARFECSTRACAPAGDHLLLIGQVERFDERGGQCLIYHRGGFADRS
jgi:3-hydroxy-9,10-secoandrosta-1,3,5(10)-triene-9,17-dione monooxygenase reductase component